MIFGGYEQKYRDVLFISRSSHVHTMSATFRYLQGGKLHNITANTLLVCTGGKAAQCQRKENIFVITVLCLSCTLKLSQKTSTKLENPGKHHEPFMKTCEQKYFPYHNNIAVAVGHNKIVMILMVFEFVFTNEHEF